MLVGRVLTGLVDLASGPAIMYVGEVADTNNRSCNSFIAFLNYIHYTEPRRGSNGK